MADDDEKKKKNKFNAEGSDVSSPDNQSSSSGKSNETSPPNNAGNNRNNGNDGMGGGDSSGSLNNNKSNQRLSKDQNELANIARQASDAGNLNLGGNDLSSVLADAVKRGEESLYNGETGENNMGFFNKGLANTLGAPVDMAGGAANELRRFSDFVGGLRENATGQAQPKAGQVDYSNAFGGSNSFRRGMANLGAKTPDRDPVTFMEQISQGTGEILPYAVPALGAMSKANNVRNAASTVAKTMTAGDFLAPEESGLPQANEGLQSAAQGSEFEAMSSIKGSDQMRGYLKGSSADGDSLQSRVMTPQEVAAFNEGLSSAPSYSGTPQEGMKPTVDSNGGLVYGNEAAQNQQISSLGQKQALTPQQNYANFDMDALSPEDRQRKLDEAAIFAASMGKSFDEDKGYVTLNPEQREEALANYANLMSARQSEAQAQQPTLSNGRSSYSEESDRRQQRAGGGTQGYVEASNAREQGDTRQPEFNEAFVYNSKGEKVATNTDAASEVNIIREARAAAKMEGLSGSERTAFINRYVDDRRDAFEQRSIAREASQASAAQAEQTLLKSQIDNFKEMNPEKAEVSESEMKTAYGMLENAGVTMNPETGDFTYETDGTVYGKNDTALSPSSSLFRQLNQTDAGRAILNTPPSVIANATGAEVGKTYKDNNGRFWKKTNTETGWELVTSAVPQT